MCVGTRLIISSQKSVCLTLRLLATTMKDLDKNRYDRSKKKTYGKKIFFSKRVSQKGQLSPSHNNSCVCHTPRVFPILTLLHTILIGRLHVSRNTPIKWQRYVPVGQTTESEYAVIYTAKCLRYVTINTMPKIYPLCKPTIPQTCNQTLLIKIQ